MNAVDSVRHATERDRVRNLRAKAAVLWGQGRHVEAMSYRRQADAVEDRMEDEAGGRNWVTVPAGRAD